MAVRDLDTPREGIDPSLLDRRPSRSRGARGRGHPGRTGGWCSSPARTWIETALRRGASVVTANKALMADGGTDSAQLAHENGADLLYEASVGRRHPHHPRAAHVARGREDQPGHGHRQRYDELHPLPDDQRGPRLRRRAARGPGARVRRSGPHGRRRSVRRRRQGADPLLPRDRYRTARRADLARGHRRGALGRRRLRATRGLRHQTARRRRTRGRARALATHPPRADPRRSPPRVGARGDERRLRRGRQERAADVARTRARGASPRRPRCSATCCTPRAIV